MTKSTTRLHFPILALSLAIAAVFLALSAISIPQFDTSTNSTIPTSPATYSPSNNYSFQINFTNAANTTFQLGSPGGGLANYTDNTTGLVGYWRLNAVNGTNYTKDFSGYGNDGSLGGGSASASPWLVSGQIGNALQFDGVNDYVSISNSNLLQITWTVEAWVYPLDKTTRKFYFSQGNSYFEFNGAGQIYSYSYQGGGNDTVSITDGTYTTNTWYHVVTTYNGSNSYLYVNGILKGTDTASGTTLAGTTRIGEFGSNGYYFNGTIDEVRIWNRSLSADEIKMQYNSSKYYPYTSNVSISENNDGDVNGATLTRLDNTSLNLDDYVGYWALDDGNGASATDESLNKNAGTLVNMNNTGNNMNGTIPSGWTSGKYGDALGFDGTNDYVNAGNGASLNITDAITIEAWVKSVGNTTKMQTVWLGENAGGDTKNYLALRTDGKIFFDQYPPGGGAIFSNSILNYNSWYHVVAVQNTTWRGIYINGVLDNSDNSPETYSGGAIIKWVIGRRTYNVDTFNGTIDEVRIYNRSLSAAEIKALYEMRNSTTSDNIQLGAGEHYYKAYSPTTQNYTKTEFLLPFEISQNNTNPINLWFRNATSQYLNQNMTITYSSNSNTTAMAYDIASLYYNDFLNNSLNNTNMTLAAGIYKITANTSGVNYTFNSTTFYINIAKGFASIRLFLNGTEGNKNYNIPQTANFTAFSNASDANITLMSNYPGFASQLGTQSVFNYTRLLNSGAFNITAFMGSENYTFSQIDYIFNVTGVIANMTVSLALHLGSIFADDSLQNGNNYDCVQDGSGWFGLTAENPQQAQSGNLSADYNMNVSGTTDNKIYLAAGRGSCNNFGNRAADAQLKRFLSPLISFSYAKTNLIQLILQFNGTDITNDAHWGKGTYLLSIANQGYNSASGNQMLAARVVK